MLSRLKAELIKLWQIWTLVFLIVTFAIGILFALLLPFYRYLVIVLAIIVVICLLLGVWKKLHLLFLLAALCTGFIWASVDLEGLNCQVAKYPVDTSLRIKAVVVDEATLDDGRLKLTVKTEGESYKLLVYGERIPVEYGDVVLVRGEAAKNKEVLNEGAFNYSRYLLTNDVVATIFADTDGIIVADTGKGNLFMSAALNMRNRIEKSLAKLPEDQAKLVAGIVLGDKAGLENADKQVLSQTGIMHLFAVSGGNVLYVVMLAMALASLCHFKRWGKLSVVIVFVVLFSAMTGFSASVVRSSIMAVIATGGLILGEKNDGPTSLFIAAFVCLLWSPLFLFDAGFQLSFVATAGIIFTRNMWGKWLPVKFLAITLAAQMAVAPLIAYYFSVFTVVGLILSPIAVAMAGVIVVLGLLAVPFSLIGCGDVPLYGAGLMAKLMFDGAGLANNLPGAYHIVASPHLFVVFIYYVLLLLAIWFARKPKLKLKDKLFVVLPAILAVALLFIPAKQNDDLQITFMDVGQGDGILIQTPAGKDILIDAGGNDMNLKGVGEYTVLPYLRRQGVDDIEMMINSHPHSDHAGGLLAVLEQMPVDELVLGDNYDNVALQTELLGLAKSKGVDVNYVDAGSVITPEKGLTISVYSPPKGKEYTEADANSGSLVMKITYGDFDLLLTGDLEGEEQTYFIGSEDWSGIDYLQIPHHGSENSYDEAWYSKFYPDGVIISVGRNNSYGQPADSVVNYWWRRGVKIYRTDQDGAITINTDGTKWDVDTYAQ